MTSRREGDEGNSGRKSQKCESIREDGLNGDGKVPCVQEAEEKS